MPDFTEISKEINPSGGSPPNNSIDDILFKYIEKLYNFTERNVIIYYAATERVDNPIEANVCDDDLVGFMTAISKIDNSKGLDLLLHTNGGSTASAQRICDYLYDEFQGNVRAIIPLKAMSAGTSIACSCKEIVMGHHSSIGRIDPQLLTQNGQISATKVLDELETIFEEVKKDPFKVQLYQCLFNKYDITFLEQCRSVLKWSRSDLRKNLTRNMLKNAKSKKAKIDKIIRRLSSEEGHGIHGAPINHEEAKELGLIIKMLEDDDHLQDLVLSVHHCLIYAIKHFSCIKIICNQDKKLYTFSIP